MTTMTTMTNAFDLGDRVWATTPGGDRFPAVVIEFEAAEARSFVVPEFEGILQNGSSLEGWFKNHWLIARKGDDGLDYFTGEKEG